MPLTGPGLSALVFADHLALFPLALNARRSNPNTGVPPHIVPEALITGICTGYVTALTSMTIFDLGVGVLGVPPGVAAPVPFTFPAIPAAIAQFLATQGWVGPQAAGVATSFVGNVLLRASQTGLLQMNPNPLMASGAGVVSPASNPALLGAMQAALSTSILVSLQATGKFAVEDIPGGPVNPTLARQVPAYAAALATGTASMVAAVAYVGAATPPTPVAGAVNFGRVL